MKQLNHVTEIIQSLQYNDVEQIIINQQEYQIIMSKVKKNKSNILAKKGTKNTQHINRKTQKKITKTNKTIHNNDSIKKDITEQPTEYSTIVSPMVGNFYRSPAPNEPAFIDLNQIVKPKQTVCIIEAMKLMNEIESEVQGEIVEILVKDGDIVDCGQALMRVKIKT